MMTAFLSVLALLHLYHIQCELGVRLAGPPKGLDPLKGDKGSSLNSTSPVGSRYNSPPIRRTSSWSGISPDIRYPCSNGNGNRPSTKQGTRG